MKKHVVFNTWSGAFFNPGGGEVQLNNTRKQLEKKGFTVDLYNQWEPQRNTELLHQFSIQPGVEYPMTEYRALGKKIFLSTILWAEYPKETEAYRYLHRILNMPDILFANSNMESEKLARAFDVDIQKFHKTVNGISEDYLNQNTPSDFRRQHKIDGDFVLSVANIDRRKNTHVLAEACMQLSKQVVLVGHTRDYAYFEEFRHRYSNVKYLGPIENSDILKSAYQQCELFLLPSLCETPSIAALEAASQGAKIAITSEGSTKEYFQDFATYVDPQRLDSVIEGIQSELKMNRDPKKIAAHITENFTWEKTAQQVIEGYQRLL